MCEAWCTMWRGRGLKGGELVAYVFALCLEVGSEV